MKPTDFSYYLSIFLTSYLAGLRNLSSNTIKSYRDTFVLLLEFIKDNHGVSPEKVTIKYVDKIIIEEFLGWLESSRNNVISTRNQRLAGIHAFFRYLQGEKPEYLFHCQKILAIPVKRSPQASNWIFIRRSNEDNLEDAGHFEIMGTQRLDSAKYFI